MGQSYKPAGYSPVSVYLIVDDAQGVVDFLAQTFDAIVARRYDRPDGSIMHAEVKIEDSVVMLSQRTDQYSAYVSHLHVYVPDVDATYQRALAAGGVSIQEPRKDEHDPDRRGGVKDAAGNAWWMATQVDE